MKRRLLACAALLLALPGFAEAEGVLRIGVLNDQTSVFADSTGPGSVLSAQMAAEDFGGSAGGRKIEIIAADHQNKPDVGIGIARNWFDRDGVDAIADLGNSAVALAVADVARQKNKAVLVSAGGTTALTGAACSPNTVQWTYDTWSNATTLAKALIARDEKTWFFITADYTFGHNLQDEATRVLEQSGGKVLGSALHPINAQDFSSPLLQAQASGARVIGLANGGDDTGRALKQAREFQISPKQTMVGMSALITDVAGLGLEATQGMLLAETFYWDLNDGTRDFSKRWAARNKGRFPTMMQAGVYAAVLHYLKAVQAGANPDDGAVTVAKMKAMPTDDALFGKGYIRADGRTIHDSFVFQVKTPAESKYPWDYYKLVARIPGEEAFRPMAQGGCKLVNP